MSPKFRPRVGNKFRVADCNVYEYLGKQGDDPSYCHALRLVERGKHAHTAARLGDVILVELPWFTVRVDVRVVP